MYLEKNGQGWQKVSDEYSLKKLNSNSPEYQKFQEIDNILGGGLLDYNVVWAVYNERLVNSFINYRFILSSRHQDDPKIFSKKDWYQDSEPNRREWTIDIYNQYVEKFSWNMDMEASLSLLPVIVAAHGTANEIAQKICRNGFAALSSLDQGYYGQGIYFTCHVPYIFPYIATIKNPTMLIVLIFPGNVYPVIEKPTDENSLLGKPMKSGYQAHYVITSKKGLPVEDMTEKDIYDELVIIQESQILPVYLIELNNSNFAELGQEWLREIPFNYEAGEDISKKISKPSLVKPIRILGQSTEERF